MPAEVFINGDLARAGSLVGGRQALSQRLLVVALEEVAHHVTEARTTAGLPEFLARAVKLAAARVQPVVV